MLSNNGYGVKDKLLLVMTRNEEIQNYAYNNCINDDVDDTSYSLIVETARWADETMIERAREWVKNAFTGPFGEGLANSIADEFVKAMKGE
jgi:hypothetical protein